MSEPLQLAYFDASALVKRYIAEPGSSHVNRLMAENLVTTSRISEVEIASALARRCREGDFSADDRDQALGALREDLRSFLMVEVSAKLSRRCPILLKRHALRAGDALHLASCLQLEGELGLPFLFVAFDRRLNEAAEMEGLKILS